MKKSITAAFDTYSKAQEVVRELELAGITGAEVEVISDSEHDVRDTKKTSSDSHFVGSTQKDASPEFSDDAASLPKQPHPGRTLVIVAASDGRTADRVTELLRQHGGENVSGTGDPAATSQQDKPENTPPRGVGNKTAGLGAPGITTGADDTDLEARGKEFRTPRK